MDPGAVEHLGYLPQDMLGRNIMDFYHPEDLPVIQQIYKTVMVNGQTAGASFLSKPYRFKTHNGSYVKLETEWSCFVNPWSRQLEVVIMNSRVLKGPLVNYIEIRCINESCINK